MLAQVGREHKRETGVPDELQATAPAGTMQSTNLGTQNSTYIFQLSEGTKGKHKGKKSAELLSAEQHEPTTGILNQLLGGWVRKSNPTVALSQDTRPVTRSHTAQQNARIKFVFCFLALLIHSLIFHVRGPIEDVMPSAATKSDGPRATSAPKPNTASDALDPSTSVPEHVGYH